MGIIRPSETGRFRTLGRIGDIVLVSGVVLRFANRRGWVSEELSSQAGSTEKQRRSGVSISEVALAGAAARPASEVGCNGDAAPEDRAQPATTRPIASRTTPLALVEAINCDGAVERSHPVEQV